VRITATTTTTKKENAADTAAPCIHIYTFIYLSIHLSRFLFLLEGGKESLNGMQWGGWVIVDKE
jgi:hypothetical protein